MQDCIRDSGGIHHVPATPTIAAVVATHNRPQFLAHRSLKSVADQTRPPDVLIVVDDSDQEYRRCNRAVVDGLKARGIKTTYMKNRRMPGASGAWNTALAHLQVMAPSAFVAILDDDDEWEPEYLSQCEKAVLERDLDMTASGIVYHESAVPEGKLLDSPEQLVVSDLLVRNTHIQGSNIFVKLHRLLEAGGFDEALASTTDRDICIRLADLGTVSYGALPTHLVHHYAESDRPRMSTAGSDAKRDGLRYFFRKHGGRMSDTERSAFVERSHRLFDCDPLDESRHPPAVQTLDFGSARDHLDLVIGAITSPDATLVTNLMDSIIHRLGGRDNVTLRLILLENGGNATSTRDALREAVNKASLQGLDVVLKTLEQQAADARIFAITKEDVDKQKSIALSRTILQHYLYMETSPRGATTTVWILDDDLSLDGLEYGPRGPVGVCEIDYVSGILQLRETGASVALCQETGDSPVPAPSCMRTQLVDLYHNLHRFAGLHPDDPYPDLRDENRMSRLTRRDYYYDLSAVDTDHLEMPFWYEASDGRRSVGQAFDEMVSRLQDILYGVQVFRPLTRSELGCHATLTTPSISRGPATLVFDIHTLRDFPNVVPVVDGIHTRRSDMVWSLLNHFVAGREIVQSQLPIRHTRKTVADLRLGAERLLQDIEGHAPHPGRDKPGIYMPPKMLQDIRGYALYASLQEVFTGRSKMQQNGASPYGMEPLHLSEQEIRHAIESYKKHIQERAHAFELNFVRIMGLLSALRPLCQPDSTSEPEPWWFKSTEYAHSTAELQKFVVSIESIYTDARLDEFMKQAMNVDAGAIEQFLRNLPKIVDHHRSNTPLPAGALRRSADAYVRSEFSTGTLTYLGMGEEGVVLTDGRLVYKYFHYWSPKDRKRHISFLQSLAGRLSGYRTLPPVLEVRRKGGPIVVVYPYESSTKYSGGHLDGLLSLLRECRRAGIACRNIHPDNIRVTSSGIQFIDYGADIVPINDIEFEQMCRRAFLTYRFSYRLDLKRLMTRALSDATLAELAGLEQFRNAIEPRGLDTLYYQPMARLIAKQHPRSVMDYGSGNGRLSKRLNDLSDAEIVQYDPDTTTIKKYQNRQSGNVSGGTELRARLLADSARFDVVVCGWVLCTIPDDSEFEDVLRDLRRFVADSGMVFVSVCNPFYLGTTSTEIAEKHLPNNFQHNITFSYDKTLISTGRRRVEVHRDYASYEQAFSKAGLSVQEVQELDGTDTRHILPASEHLVFLLSPVSLDGPRVSLLIKTCLMEWRTIERLVRHQVKQLESPYRFVEKVVIVDPYEGPFQRQYDHPDSEAHRNAMKHLLRDGVVDRVVYAPTDTESVYSAYRRWFGAESTKAHSANGQQLFASLFGFDSCTGDYVLQIDCDMMIARIDKDHDYLSEMTEVLRLDPEALFVSMNICRARATPYTTKGADGDWRVDVRGCLYDRRRLLSVLPIPNELTDGQFTLAWHRAFDRFIASSTYHTYRGGSPKTAVVHVPNHHKMEIDEWMDILGTVERGYVPDVQLDNAELIGSTKDWSGPRRSESVVFVICGRNVQHGRFKRCIQSLVSQRGVEWGAVVVDDASTNGFGDYARILLADYESHVTLIRNNRRRGGLYNTWKTITQVCTDPETVIITLDADDALIGGHVLERVWAEYADGADATVGSMLRLDKNASYQANFDNPRQWNSNVWQHLRTFKKRLFDAISVEDLKINGEWIDLAADWAYMVPIIEMASSPRLIPDLLYLYEPAVPKDASVRMQRNRIIEVILSKTPYTKLR